MTPEKLDLDGVLDFVRGVLTDPAGCSQQIAPEYRPGFQSAVYPQGLRYNDGSFGTTESSWAFGYLREIEGSVSQTRPSWNQTWDWLQAVEELRQSLSGATGWPQADPERVPGPPP